MENFSVEIKQYLGKTPPVEINNRNILEQHV